MVLFASYPFEVIGRLFEKSTSEPLLMLALVSTFLAIGLYIYLFVLYIKDGDKKNNRFGKNIYKKKRK